MVEKTEKLKTEPSIDANMYLQLITYTIKCSNSLQAMAAPLRKIGKKKGHFWIFGWWVWFFTHWSAATALVEKDEADSCHRWPQYNALPGRVKGCYSFRYPNKVQLRFWLIQILFWKPNSREIDVPPLCEMSFIQPVEIVISRLVQLFFHSLYSCTASTAVKWSVPVFRRNPYGLRTW